MAYNPIGWTGLRAVNYKNMGSPKLIRMGGLGHYPYNPLLNLSPFTTTET